MTNNKIKSHLLDKQIALLRQQNNCCCFANFQKKVWPHRWNPSDSNEWFVILNNGYWKWFDILRDSVLATYTVTHTTCYVHRLVYVLFQEVPNVRFYVFLNLSMLCKLTLSRFEITKGIKIKSYLRMVAEFILIEWKIDDWWRHSALNVYPFLWNCQNIAKSFGFFSVYRADKLISHKSI